jgi:antitoxin HicB
MRYAYPAVLEPQDDGGFTVTFEGLPGATQGETEAEALREAADLLVTSLSFFTDKGEALPRPAPADGRPLVEVPPLVAAKLALHDAMVEASVSNVELARRLGADEKAVRRLRDPLHRSHIGAVEDALRTLGRRLVVDVLELA